jgi:hypothetical protein
MDSNTNDSLVSSLGFGRRSRGVHLLHASPSLLDYLGLKGFGIGSAL